jgi:chemotaxis protein CheD
MIANQNHNGVFHIGERNAETAKAVLSDLGVRIHAVDTGGNRGRTVRLHLESGRLMVSSVGGPSHEL